MPSFIWQRIGYCVLFGGTVGAGLDFLHTVSQTILYPADASPFRGIRTFAIAYTVGAVLGTGWCLITKTPKPVPYSVSLPWLGLYCLGYAGTAFADRNPFVTAAVLGLTGLYGWWKIERSWQTLLAGLVTVGLGIATESYLSHTDVMSYQVQHFLKVPVWLPFLYFLGAVGWGPVARRLLTIK